MVHDLPEKFKMSDFGVHVLAKTLVVINVCSILQKTNCPVMIPKTVMLSGRWRGS